MKLNIDRYNTAFVTPLLAMRPIVLDTKTETIRIFRTEAPVGYTRALSSPCPTREHEHATAGHCGVKMIVSEAWAREWDSHKVKVANKIPAIGVFQVIGHAEYGNNVLWCDAVLLWGIAQPSWSKFDVSRVSYVWPDPFDPNREIRATINSLDGFLEDIRYNWKQYRNDEKYLE